MRTIRQLISGIIAVILMSVNVIYNGYLLSFIYAVSYALLRAIFWQHATTHGNVFWGFLGFGSLAALITLGLLFSAVWFSRIVMGVRLPLPVEEEQVLSNLSKRNQVNILISEKPELHVEAMGRNIIITSLALNSLPLDELRARLAAVSNQIDSKLSMIRGIIVWAGMPSKLVQWLYKFYSKLASMVSLAFSREGSLFNLALLVPLILFVPVAILNYLGSWLSLASMYVIDKTYDYAMR